MDAPLKRLLCRRVVIAICDEAYTWKQTECDLFQAVRGARHCKYLEDKGPGLCKHPDVEKLLAP